MILFSDFLGFIVVFPVYMFCCILGIWSIIHIFEDIL